MADYFDDSNDDEGDFDEHLGQATREHTIFLVDASKQMLNEINEVGIEGFEPSDTYLEVALKVVRELMKQHIISSPKDQMGLIFYGAAQPKNESSFEAINIAMDLEETTADRIREVESLTENFGEAVGSADKLNPEDVRDSFWAATQVLQESKGKAAKRVMLFTNTDNPFPGAGRDAKEQIASRAQALHESKIETELFNLGNEFSMDFWGDIFKDPEDDLGTQSFDKEPLRLQDLSMNIRRKAYKKRALASLYWHMGPDFKFAVKLYALIQKATTSKSLPIDLKTNQVLKAKTAYIDDDTGALIDRVTKFSFPKDEKQAPRFPKVVFTAEERAALKQLRPPGLRLIGFKKLSTLRSWYQLRPATFVYPDDRKLKGSATVFIVLHDTMLRRGVYALCSIVRSKASEPRLVAAVPQQEEIDESGTQEVPPGFNLIYLPYKDDIRYPEEDPSFMGPHLDVKITDKQMDAARDLLQSLMIQDFSVGSLPNPHLQRHYKVVEALALGQEPPEMKPEDDLMLPEPFTEEQDKRAIAFRDAIYGQGQQGPLKNVLKRKAEEKATEDLDIKEYVKEGKLSKLTVKILMELCRQQRLSTQGRKQELVDRLSQHVDSA